MSCGLALQSQRHENSIQLQITNKSVQEDIENPNHLYQVKGVLTGGNINSSWREIHKKSTNTPIQAPVRWLLRAPVSREPITWERMKFVL